MFIKCDTWAEEHSFPDWNLALNFDKSPDDTGSAMLKKERREKPIDTLFQVRLFI
jgi:hypothetical protein